MNFVGESNPTLQQVSKIIEEELLPILKAKGEDYANTKDRFANFSMGNMMNIDNYKSVSGRISDKISRMQGFARKETFSVKDEGLRDACLDLANYCFLLFCVFRNSYIYTDNDYLVSVVEAAKDLPYTPLYARFDRDERRDAFMSGDPIWKYTIHTLRDVYKDMCYDIADFVTEATHYEDLMKKYSYRMLVYSLLVWVYYKEETGNGE